MLLAIGQEKRRLSREETASLYERTGALVLRRCRLILRNDADAQDTMQEVFLRLMKYAAPVEGQHVPLSYLYRTAERCCFDRLRKRTREPSVDPQDFMESLVQPDDPAGHETFQLVMRFFHGLEPKLKQVALLHYVDGLTQESIAQQLGWSRRTVGKKLKQLKQRAERMDKKFEVN